MISIWCQKLNMFQLRIQMFFRFEDFKARQGPLHHAGDFRGDQGNRGIQMSKSPWWINGTNRIFFRGCRSTLQTTLPETDIGPENMVSQKEIPFQFLGRAVSFRGLSFVNQCSGTVRGISLYILTSPIDAKQSYCPRNWRKLGHWDPPQTNERFLICSPRNAGRWAI